MCTRFFCNGMILEVMGETRKEKTNRLIYTRAGNSTRINLSCRGKYILTTIAFVGEIGAIIVMITSLTKVDACAIGASELRRCAIGFWKKRTQCSMTTTQHWTWAICSADGRHLLQSFSSEPSEQSTLESQCLRLSMHRPSPQRNSFCLHANYPQKAKK